MKPESKQLLRNSLAQFRAASTLERDEMVHTVQNNLRIHENALKSIGMGYADKYVTAGRVFLRIVKS